jgi:predicted GNAT family acetyltransferase
MKNNKDLTRFERAVGDDIVFANYRLDGHTLYINYVEAPEALRGSGEAGKLMADIMEFAKAEGYKVFPICSYAVAWLRRHPQYESLMAA